MDQPWLKSYDSGVPHANLDYPIHKDFITVLDEKVELFSEKTALIYFGRRISYRQLRDLSCRFALVLKKLGVQKGDRVVIHLPNVPQFVIAYLGILRLCAIAVPVSTLYYETDLERALGRVGAKVIITLTKFVEKILPTIQKFPDLTVLTAAAKEYLPFFKKQLFIRFREKSGGHRLPKSLTGLLSMDDLLKKQQACLLGNRTPIVQSETTAVIQCTGGVTGEPKAVELTHQNLLANCTQIGAWMRPVFAEGREVIAAMAPLFHVHGLTNILSIGLLSGSTVVLFPDPRDIDLVLKQIRQYKVTILPGVPLFFQWFLRKEGLREYFTTVKLCISGGSPLTEEVAVAFTKASGCNLVEGYGLSEASPTTHINPILGLRRFGGIGLPLPDTQAKIIDLDTGQELGPDQKGELWIKGPQVMSGYFEDPDATAAVLKDGWLRTGDIASCDKDGYYEIVDRKKDLIFVGYSGLKVYPSQVEAVIKQHPSVEDAVLVGKPLPEGGEAPVLFLVPKTTADRNRVIDEVRDFCQQKLARYKVPREIFIVDTIPQNFLGKQIRRLFRN